MNKELIELNFNKLLLLDTDLQSYNFDQYILNKKHPIKGFCLICENDNCNKSPNDHNFKLSTISHGASSDDFFSATNFNSFDEKWKDEGVLFLMESPSSIYDFYKPFTYNGITKTPTREWYWVHDKQQHLKYPAAFKGGEYGTLFESVVFTFRLKNAYITNLVKCGLNNDDKKYKGIDFYNWKSVVRCYKNYLEKEIQIINPKVIFCFGSKVEYFFRELHPKDSNIKIVGLPHPAGQRRGFKDEYYKHLYLSMITEGLFKAGILTFEEATEKLQLLFSN